VTRTLPLRLNREFRSVYVRGKSSAGVYLVVHVKPNRLPRIRLGLTVSRKLGGAVQRNRVRRRMREAYRLNEGKFRPGLDIVLVARTRAAKADFRALQDDVLAAARRLGALLP
jgi:ribonuclease P protein component